MRDEHEGRGGEIRRCADIGRVATEELTQSRIGEVGIECPGEVLERGGSPKRTDFAQPHGTDEAERRGPFRADERFEQRVVDLAAAPAEPPVAVGVTWTCELSNGSGCLFQIRMQIKTSAVAPGVPREYLGGPQCQFAVKVMAGRGKQLVEHPAHGEDGRPRIHRPPANQNGAHLAARRLRRLDDGDVAPGNGEIDGSREPAHPGPDDDHAARLHAPVDRRRDSFRRTFRWWYTISVSPTASGTAQRKGLSASDGKRRTAPKAKNAV